MSSSSSSHKHQELAQILACNPPGAIIRHFCDYRGITMDFKVKKKERERKKELLFICFFFF